MPFVRAMAASVPPALFDNILAGSGHPGDENGWSVSCRCERYPFGDLSPSHGQCRECPMMVVLPRRQAEGQLHHQEVEVRYRQAPLPS